MENDCSKGVSVSTIIASSSSSGRSTPALLARKTNPANAAIRLARFAIKKTCSTLASVVIALSIGQTIEVKLFSVA